MERMQKVHRNCQYTSVKLAPDTYEVSKTTVSYRTDTKSVTHKINFILVYKSSACEIG